MFRTLGVGGLGLPGATGPWTADQRQNLGPGALSPQHLALLLQHILKLSCVNGLLAARVTCSLLWVPNISPEAF